jgi:hypothetical protein
MMFWMTQTSYLLAEEGNMPKSNITLKELESKIPSQDQLERYTVDNRWVVHNFFREKIIAQKLKDCSLFEERFKNRKQDEINKETFKPVDMQEISKKTWYNDPVILGGFAISFSLGATITYLLIK